MACISTALIIGGGIGGLSAALALARIGVKCDVVELADAPLGASLGISGRAAEALEELGIYTATHDAGTPFGADTTALSIRDWEGTLISPGPARPSWSGCKDAVGIYRPVFLEIIADAALRLGVNIRKGLTTRTIVERDDHAVVTFTDGEQRRYDLVVGADGIGSRTREFLFPGAAKPTYSGQWSIRWMAPGSAIEDEGWYLGPVGRLGFYYLPQGFVYVPAVFDVPKSTRMSQDEVRSAFTKLLDSFTAPAVVELRRRLTPESLLIGRPFEWLLLPAPWYRGRTILIGDAAHATTAHMGMGGGMAVEDAVVLAQCLRAAATVDEALDSFMTRRFARVQTVVETSLALSRLEQDNAPPSESAALMTSAFQTLAAPY